MPKLDLDTIPQTNATGYPAPYADAVQDRWYRRLAPPSSLTEMGVSHVTLKPGAWSSQRHWHADEDEFVVMLAGEAVLVEDGGETLLRAGDCAAFPKGIQNGHHLQNRGTTDCMFVAVSAGPRGSGDYPDIDMQFTPEGYFHKNGTRYETKRLP
ncbi:cupin domain-containing protein [Sphingomonas sp. LM7]|uniref:cupin domain-containing protein n=1 Tax=Sphingomonas sp. LM7 TaxID=1938607 RepID=UPI000983CA38|nr:cupin domain-containing protein [Sphingomonas sp. LM7]AQR72276.1 transcriptional regulator [Sphingomonas sp. LM7]